jgi:acyl carrier protein
MQTEKAALEELIVAAVADAGGLERSSLTGGTPLIEANLDSLTLIGLVSRLELELGVVFSDEESMELVEALDIAALCATIARKVECEQASAPFRSNSADFGAARSSASGFNGVGRLHGEAAESVKEDDDGRLDDVDA